MQLLIALFLVATSAQALAIETSPGQPGAATTYTAVIINISPEMDLACVVWSEQQIECQAIRKSNYRQCAIVNGGLDCNAI